MLTVKNVVKVYKNRGSNKVVALNDISFNLPSTGLVFILGKSGSGKTTLLNILGGLDNVTSGEVIIDGFSTNHFSSSNFDSFRNSYIGYIFQEFYLVDDMNVYENIDLSLKIQNKKTDINDIENILRVVELENLGFRKPAELSGGQRQRIAIARALLKDAKIILADEPTGALDSQTGEKIIQTLKKVSKDRLVIVVSHDVDLGYRFADRIISINDGKIINDVVRKKLDERVENQILNDKLLRVSHISGVTDKAKLDELIDGNKDSYLILTQDKQLIALANKEDFDVIYEETDFLNEFENSGDVLFSKEDKTKKLPKLGIRFKECFNMALQNVKRKKKRFVFLTIFLTFAISFLFIVFSFQNLSYENTIYASVNEYNPDFVYLSQQYYSSGSQIDMESSGIPYINIYPTKVDNPVGNDTNYAVVYNYEDYNFNLLDSTRPALTDKSGSITDVLGNEILSSFVTGYDIDGNYCLISETNLLDLIGYTLLFDDKEFKIENIIVTNDYSSGYSSTYSFDYYNSFFMNETYYDIVLNTNNDPNSLSDCTLYTNYFDTDIVLKNQNEYTILAGNDIDEYDQILISLDAYYAIYSTYDVSSFAPFDITLTITRSVSNYFTRYIKECEIVGVYDASDENLNECVVILHEDLFSAVETSFDDSTYTTLLDYTSDEFKSFLDDLPTNYSILFSNFSVWNFTTSLESLSKVLQVVTLISLCFAFLIAYLFMSSSVKYRNKEIGILKSQGARSIDVFKIFQTESFIISLINTIFIYICFYAFTEILNANLSSSSFNIVIMQSHVWYIIPIFLVSYLFITVASLFPVMRVALQKPVNSLKGN